MTYADWVQANAQSRQEAEERRNGMIRVWPELFAVNHEGFCSMWLRSTGMCRLYKTGSVSK